MFNVFLHLSTHPSGQNPPPPVQEGEDFIALLLKVKVVGQAQRVPDRQDLPLYRLTHGHAPVLPLQPGEVLLLPCGVDALAARGPPGRAQGPADLPGGLSEGLPAHKRLRVHHEEEVPQAVHPWVSFLVLTGESLHELDRKSVV